MREPFGNDIRESNQITIRASTPLVQGNLYRKPYGKAIQDPYLPVSPEKVQATLNFEVL